jgi:hypothetical protein
MEDEKRNQERQQTAQTKCTAQFFLTGQSKPSSLRPILQFKKVVRKNRRCWRRPQRLG